MNGVERSCTSWKEYKYIDRNHNQCYFTDLSDEREVLAPFGACLSLVAYATLLYSYYIDKQPCLRKHPANIMLTKCVLECLFVYPFLFQYNSDFYWDEDCCNCEATRRAGFFSFCTQFTLLGSELYFLLLLLDLHSQCSNPFASFQSNYKFYNIAILGFALIMAGILISVQGSREYVGSGSSYGLWIQDCDEDCQPQVCHGGSAASHNKVDLSANERSHITLLKVFFFYGWMAAIYGYAIYVITFVSIRLREGLARTLQTRLKLATRAQKYVTGYTVYWVIVLGLDFLVTAFPQENLQGVHNLMAFVLTFRGVVSVGIIYYTFYDDWVTSSLLVHLGLSQDNRKEENTRALQSAHEEEVAAMPHLNSTLRAEVLLFTTQGIRCVIEDYNRSRLAEEEEYGLDTETRSNSIIKNQYTADEMDAKVSNMSTLRKPAPRDSILSTGSACSSRSSVRLSSTSRRASVARREFVFSDFDHANVDLRNKRDNLNRRISRRDSANGQLSHGADICDGTSTPPSEPAGRTESPMHPAQKKTLSETENGNSSDGDDDKDEERDEFDVEAGVTDAQLNRLNSQGRTITTKKSVFMLSGDDMYGGIQAQHLSELDTVNNAARRRVSTVTGATVKEDDLFIDEDPMETSKAFRESVQDERVSYAAQGSQVDSEDSESFTDMATRWWKAAQRMRAQRKNFIFKDYCPELFGEIRRLSGVKDDEYVRALGSTAKERFTEGASGSFLYFSNDMKYIVKTTSKEDKDVLVRILPSYVSYLRDNPNSLLVRFYGLHSIMMYNQRLQFVVMGNAFAGVSPSERYDLKGSWVNRSGENPRSRLRRFSDKGDSEQKVPLFKDNDLQHKFRLKKPAVAFLRAMMKRDSEFLSSNGLMDYSLLVGVKHRKFAVQRASAPQVDDDGNVGKRRMRRVSVTDDTMKSSQIPSLPKGEPHLHTINSTLTFGENKGLLLPENPGSADLSSIRNASGGYDASVVQGPEEYWFCIIDVLQEWTLWKRLEAATKRVFKRADGDGLSAIPADEYGRRFCERVVLDAFDDSFDGDFED